MFSDTAAIARPVIPYVRQSEVETEIRAGEPLSTSDSLAPFDDVSRSDLDFEPYSVDANGDETIDGMDIAIMATRCACTASPDERIRVSTPHDRLVSEATETYVRYHDQEWDRMYSPGYRSYYASCAPAVLVVIRASGADPLMDCLPARNQAAYFRAHADIWEEIDLPDDAIIDDVCQPGDIVNSSTHTMLYVGNELVRTRFPGSDGNMYEASEGARAYPGFTCRGNSRIRGWHVFRVRPRHVSVMDDGTVVDEAFGTR